MKKTHRRLNPFLIAIISILILFGISIVLIVIKNKENRASKLEIQNETKKVVFRDTGEVLLLEKCDFQNTSPCEIITVNLQGEVNYFPTENLFYVNNIYVSRNGKHIVYSDKKNINIVNLDTHTSKVLNFANQTNLQRVYDEGFWVFDGSFYKLFDYNGQIIKKYSQSIFPRHFKDYYDIGYYVNFSPLYESGTIFAHAVSSTGDGPRSTMLALNNKGSFVKLDDLWGIYDKPIIHHISFLEDKTGVLISSNKGIYILNADNSKTPVFEDAYDSKKIRIDDVVTNKRSDKYYYHLEPSSESTQEDYDILGTYVYDLTKKENKIILSSSRDSKTYWKFTDYKILSLSPSEEYASVSVHVVGDGSTRYTPAILSLKNYSLKTFSQLTGKFTTSARFLGWINKNDVDFVINSLRKS